MVLKQKKYKRYELAAVLLLNLMLFITFSNHVSATNLPLVYSNAKTTELRNKTGAPMSSLGDGGITQATGANNEFNVFEPDFGGLNCTINDVESLTVLATYHKTPGVTDYEDNDSGGVIIVGDVVNLYQANESISWGVPTNIQGHPVYPDAIPSFLPYTGWVIRDLKGLTLVTSADDDGDLIGGTWSDASAPVALDVLVNVGLGQFNGPDESIYITEPTADVTFKSNSECMNSNSNPVASPTSTSIPSTIASGTVIISGSTFSASDVDNDALSYAISSGNSSYFTINSMTGDISTNQANIPEGEYKLLIEVNDGKGGSTAVDANIIVTSDVHSGTSNTAPTNKPVLAKSGHNSFIIMVISTAIMAAAVFRKLIIQRFS